MADLTVFLFLREIILFFMCMVSQSKGHREKANFFLKRQTQELLQHTHAHTCTHIHLFHQDVTRMATEFSVHQTDLIKLVVKDCKR